MHYLTRSLLALALALPLTSLADNEKIEHVMKTAFKAPKGTPKLVEKVIDGTASDQELKDFAELVKALPAEKPPRGDEASWKTKSEALAAAAALCAAKDPSGPAKLKEAANCKACHKEHKPE